MKKALLIASALLMFTFIGCCPCRLSTKSTSQNLANSEWRLEQLTGTDFRLDRSSTYTLRFAEDGGLSGDVSCNKLLGGYSYDREQRTLKLTPSGTTMMMCPDDSHTGAWLKSLEQVSSYEREGQRLMLFADGELVAILKLAIKADRPL